MEFISPVKIRVEQNDSVFEGYLKRTKNKHWEQFVVMNASEIKIDKKAKVTVLKNLETPVINSEYKGIYADLDHDEWKDLNDLRYYEEHLGFNRD
jgi:hypothetical protein